MTVKTTTYHLAHEELMQMASTGMIGFTLPAGTEKLIIKTEKYDPNAEIVLEPLPALSEEEFVDQYFDGLNIPYREAQRYIIAEYLKMTLDTFGILEHFTKEMILDGLRNDLMEQKIHHHNITDAPEDFDSPPF